MAYSSIGHMGFALVGLAAGTAEGVQGVLVYMAIYVAMTLGAFAVHPVDAARRAAWSRTISDLAGLARTHPAMAFFLAMLLFSMAGIPPLAGFFAKFYVFLAAIKAGLYVLAVIGVLASVVGAYYYLRSSRSCISTSRREGFVRMPDELKAVLAVCGLFNLLFFALSGPLVGAATRRGEIAVLMRLRSSGVSGRASPVGSTRRLPRPMPKRWRARAPASAARSGSRRERQTAGRGRRGNAWISEPGNLYATLLLDRSGAAAIARRNCRSSPRLRCTTRSSDCAAALSWRLALKWPNDVLCDGAKLAGILIEGESRGQALAVAIGIGVNCAHHPAGTPYPATDLAAAGVAVVA